MFTISAKYEGVRYLFIMVDICNGGSTALPRPVLPSVQDPKGCSTVVCNSDQDRSTVLLSSCEIKPMQRYQRVLLLLPGSARLFALPKEMVSNLE